MESVDDLARAGYEEFKSIAKKMLDLFETNGNKEILFTFAWTHITYTPDHIYANDQFSYTDKPMQRLIDSTFRENYSMRIRLAWIFNTIPDLLYKLSQFV